jgi:Flp pilus assembly protein TadD
VSAGNLPDRAGHLIDLGRPDHAVELLSQHLAAQPDDWRALCELARAHLARDDGDAASRAADAAISAAPDQEWCHRLASSAELERNAYKAAVLHAQEAVRLRPEFWQTHYILSRALLLAKKNKLAYEQACRAVQLAPLEASAHLQLCVAADARGRRRESDAALRRALELDPLSPDTLNVKAIREFERNKLVPAAHSALGALRLNPQSEVGKDTLAALMTTLLLRLSAVTVLGGVVVAGVLLAGRAGAIPPYWPRATAGVVFIGIVLWVAWLTLRHVPPAARRLTASRILRGRRLVAPVILTAAAACLIAIAFTPFDVAFTAAAAGGIVLVVLFRIAQVAFLGYLVFIVIRAVWRFVGRRDGN